MGHQALLRACARQSIPLCGRGGGTWVLAESGLLTDERLFERYPATTPRRYYLSLRLEKARQLVLQTALPITTVALACGFEAASHFSKCFRARYGYPPNSLRG